MTFDSSYDVHRLRLGDWMPSPIRSIACDPFSNKVAIGREDGDIEICDSMSKWYTQLRIPGRQDFRLQTIVWSPIAEYSGRLFGISLHGIAFEVDFITLSYKNIRHITGGAAWSLSSSPTEPNLAIGCNDGMVRIFTYDFGLEYSKAYPSTNAKVLSICHHPTLPQIFLGCSDGTIRCHDTKTSRGIYRMRGESTSGKAAFILCLQVMKDSTVVSGDSQGNVQIWDGKIGVLTMTIHQHNAEILTIAISPNENQIFASGVDSRVTCIQRSQRTTTTTTTTTGASVAINLTSSTNHEENSVENKSEKSVDEKIGTVHRFNMEDSHWIYSTAHRPHSHDVYALAIQSPLLLSSSFSSSSSSNLTNHGDETNNEMKNRNQDFEGLPILISGGLDGKICLYSIESFAKIRPLWILPIPAKGLVQSTEDGSLIAMRHRHNIDLWTILDLNVSASIDRFNSTNSVANSIKTAIGKTAIPSNSNKSYYQPLSTAKDGRCFLSCQVQLKDEEHIHSFALSPNGKYLIASTQSGCRLWSLTRDTNTNDVSVHRIPIPENIKGLATSMAFAKHNTSNQLAIALSNGNIVLLDIEENPMDISKTIVSVRHVFPPISSSYIPTFGSSNSMSRYPVLSLLFSSDGQYLIGYDSNNQAFVLDLDVMRSHWILPKMPNIITTISIQPNTHLIVILLASNQIFLFGAEDMKLIPIPISTQTLSSSSSSKHSITSHSNDKTVEISDNIPSTVKNLPGALCGISFDTSNSNKLLLYGQNAIVYVNVSDTIPLHPKTVTINSLLAHQSVSSKSSKKKRKTEDMTEEETENLLSSSNFCVVTIFRSIAHVQALDNNRMVGLKSDS